MTNTEKYLADRFVDFEEWLKDNCPNVANHKYNGRISFMEYKYFIYKFGSSRLKEAIILLDGQGEEYVDGWFKLGLIVYDFLNVGYFISAPDDEVQPYNPWVPSYAKKETPF